MIPVGIAALAVAAAVSQQTTPRAVLNGEAIEVTLPVNVFRDERFTKLLASGLTTTVVISGDDSRAVRIEIRYDLWDEIYRVTTKGEQLTLPSLDRLQQWLSTTRFRVGDVHNGRVPATVRIGIEVIPFSATEQNEAQRWLLHSISDAEAKGSATGGSRSAPTESPSAFDRMIAGSVKSKTLLSWHWKVIVTRP